MICSSVANIITLLIALRKIVTDGQRKERKITNALEHIQNSCDEMFLIREIEDKFKIKVSKLM